MFVDRAKIIVKAGNGGNGAVSFHREKFVAAGGPDGGNGGRGGDVVLVGDDNTSTLIDFSYHKKFCAGNGGNGGDCKKTGKSGANCEIRVPFGTVAFDMATGRLMADITRDNPRVVLAKGGKGGAGNMNYATATRQIPNFAKAGVAGESFEVSLELKLIADVGLIGFPNVGKSSVLCRVSNARPEVADYHFTTLRPSLGVVRLGDDASFVMADIPGLIKGAAEGAGLGHQFLRHIERTGMLVHVVDVSGREGRDPLEDFETINSELINYSEELSRRPQIVAANKMDLPSWQENYPVFKENLEARGYHVIPISAATGEGLEELKRQVYKMLGTLSKEETEHVYRGVIKVDPNAPSEHFAIQVVDGVYVVTGKDMARLVNSTNFAEYEQLQYFQRTLEKNGVVAQLEAMGISEGDTVNIEGIEFDYKR